MENIQKADIQKADINTAVPDHGGISIFLICASDFKKVAAEIERKYAEQGIRAVCYSVYNDGSTTRYCQDYPWTLRTAIATEIAKYCDMVVAAGTIMSAEMRADIKTAIECGRDTVYTYGDFIQEPVQKLTPSEVVVKKIF